MESDIITLQDVFAGTPGERARSRSDLVSSLRPLDVHGPPAALPVTSWRLTASSLPADFYQPETPLAGRRGERKRPHEVRVVRLRPGARWRVGLTVGCLMLAGGARRARASPRGAWLESRLEPYGGSDGSCRLGRTPSGERSPGARRSSRSTASTERAAAQDELWGERSSGSSSGRTCRRAPGAVVSWSLLLGRRPRRRCSASSAGRRCSLRSAALSGSSLRRCCISTRGRRVGCARSTSSSPTC